MAEEIIVYVVICDNYYNQYVAKIYDNEESAEDYISRMLLLSPDRYFAIERHCLMLN
jgi:hypothetical protein